MPFLTSRQRGLAGVVAALVAVAAITALADHVRWSIAALAALLGTTCALLLDIRHRQQAAARSQRRLEEAVAELGRSLGTDLRRLDAVAHQNAHALTQNARTFDEQATALAEVSARLEKQSAADAERHLLTSRRLARLDHEPVAEVQALLQLVSRVPDAPALPGVGGWALSAVTLLELWDLVVTERPATIVECGSGSSTVWLAYAARRAGGDVRIVSLEHNAQYAQQTRTLLARHGLKADVRHAPLEPVELDDETYRWYSTAAIKDLQDIDLLLVDGPPKATGKLARYPALPLLHERLSPGAFVVMDDAYRSDEQEATAQWSTRYGLRTERPLSRDTELLRSP